MDLSFRTATADDYNDLGRQIHEAANWQHSQEDACQTIAEMIYKTFQPEIVLARVFRLAPTDWLPENLKSNLHKHDDLALTLMGTYGVEKQWRSRHYSQHHKAMSINRIAADRAIPMMVEMLRQLGIDLDILYQTGDVMKADVDPHGIGTPIYVPDVVGSPFVPDQEGFVEPYGVRSLIGFGGMFRDFGDALSLYFVVVFTNIPIEQEQLDTFSNLQAWAGTSIAPHENMTMFND